MPNRERILKALSICLPETENDGDKNCAECPFFGRCLDDNRDDVSLPVLMVEEIRALLKAQEPMEPKKVNRYIDFDGEGHPYTPETYDCGACGKELPWKANYCPDCGRAVKWE